LLLLFGNGTAAVFLQVQLPVGEIERDKVPRQKPQADYVLTPCPWILRQDQVRVTFATKHPFSESGCAFQWAVGDSPLSNINVVLLVHGSSKFPGPQCTILVVDCVHFNLGVLILHECFPNGEIAPREEKRERSA